MASDILIYQNTEGNIKVDVRLEEETVWLTQDQMTQLFGKGRSTITEHIGNIFKEGELDEIATRRNFRLVRFEGTREVERDVEHYNLYVTISVGYRVKSIQGIQFRIKTKKSNSIWETNSYNTVARIDTKYGKRISL